MNVKEARERALWCQLPTALTSTIKAATDRGDFNTEYIASPSNHINGLRYMLEELGYSAVNDNGCLMISWK